MTRAAEKNRKEGKYSRNRKTRYVQQEGSPEKTFSALEVSADRGKHERVTRGREQKGDGTLKSRGK